jgi:hypothetical protein
MPSISASSNPDMNGWAPVNAPTQQTQQPSLPQATDRSAFMIASMPAMMSGGDLIGSQFYPNTRVPTQRILPVRGGDQ